MQSSVLQTRLLSFTLLYYMIVLSVLHFVVITTILVPFWPHFLWFSCK